MVVGFWKQRSRIIDDATGKEFEILGLGGCWFGVERQAGPDEGSSSSRGSATGSTCRRPRTRWCAIVKSGKAPDTLLERIQVFGHEVPGHYHPRTCPSTVWPPPVERGDYVTQEPR